MQLKKAGWWVGLLFAAVFMVACSNTEADGSKEDAETNEPEKMEGSVVIDGSGTVYPLMAKIAEEYMVNEQQDVSVEVSRAGTGAGFKKFLVENGTDFNDASRPIKEEEKAEAEKLGMEIKELKVALDGLTFVINKENDWATEMTPEQLISIFVAGSDVKKWSDINPDWPAEDIKPMGPNENHGTYEFFYEKVMEETDMSEHVNLQQDYSTLVNLVSEDKNGIAFFGYGYYANNTDQLQAVSVDFGNGAVEPALDTISEEGAYAQFTRPVFTYLNVDHAKENPQVLDFAKYVIENANKLSAETGFAPVPENELIENLEFLSSL
ncbi:PstS family phosphate ABC transporter substrate-binding protein [Sporosarcina sp. GW1-11]|uniref:PstS family phosphate ABC transporter substrate-binding protein n=1 Tax=Sporosarcina sp. GW1-11 TaxID=2899126 RepID=UPI00294B9EE3|nr:PstS family phosphate ABC transporter substrate-binding protein [Sporosarcina sp. GW1-11]MDV6378453.1 PstS family phosphate ABC transporter substrate-binding protein [Sporosarcina sp. GW1-11]